MLNALEYEQICHKIELYEQARKRFDSARYQNGGGYTPEEVAEIVRRAEIGKAPTNEERSEVERYNFCKNPPEHAFVYVNEKRGVVTTWPGGLLGEAHLGHEYKSPAFGGFGSRRRSIRVQAINGYTYAGTYYCSSGDYARIRICKSEPYVMTEELRELGDDRMVGEHQSTCGCKDCTHVERNKAARDRRAAKRRAKVEQEKREAVKDMHRAIGGAIE